MLEMIYVLFWNLIFIDCILIELSSIRAIVCSVMLVNGTELWKSTRTLCDKRMGKNTERKGK